MSKLLDKFKEVLKFVDDAFFPEQIKCIACNAELSFDTRYGVCQNCDIVRNIDFCKVCGSATNDLSPLCEICKVVDFEFDRAVSPLVYREQVVNIIRRFKFGSAKYMGKFLAQFVIDCFYEHDFEVDFVTFVPIHKLKLRERGFNQAKVVAEHFVQAVKLPLVDTLDKRIQNDDTAKLNRKQRYESVKGAMCVKENLCEYLKSKTVLLIDDVFTTGATANECSRLLKCAGVSEVFVLTVATGVGFTRSNFNNSFEISL
jgi:competence protein ComFC